MPADRAALRVAVIGLGTIARIAHLPTLHELDDVEIVGLCDTPEVLARHRFAPGFDDVEKLLEAVEPDAAFVLTPADTHLDLASKLITRGVATFCEKPLASTVEEARRIAQLAELHHVPVMVGFNRRFAPTYLKAKAALDTTPATIGIFQKTRRDRYYRASLDNLIHMIDLARFFFGECAHVTAEATFDDPYWEENLSATLRFDSGQLATIIGNRSCGIWTERVDLHGNGQTITVNAPSEIRIAADDTERVEQLSPAASGFDHPIDALGFAAQTRHFLAAARAGHDVTQNNARNGLATQELMDRILTAAGLPTHDQPTA
ncbi:virulence factor [Kribbella sp. VKM Ac-2527]|uniref:Virulence factor n=1 Tax=Kribbella caucasensis TaxID=2512215 RepID=A0A4R6KH39_9ACTN|nr:Gfo/Idh/MocA family oxidoreductase [Kribbella sp. VKM Ac-2527]TDO50144.1 virulence factor [Kribbella sp. VKM Ac-2527]